MRAVAGSTAKRVGVFAKTWYQLASSAAWVWNKNVRPVAAAALWLPKLAFRFYMWALWNRIAVDREGKFRPARGGVTLLATAAFLYFLGSPLAHLVGDGLLYALTVQRDHVLYLSDSQEVGDGNHDVKGCTSLPCSEDNSVYFKVESTAFNQAWSILTGRGIFYPDAIAGGILNEIGKCTATTYGIRMKTFTRFFEVYPKLISVNCSPLPEVERG